MTVLIGLVTQVVHIALVGLAAPTVVGIERWMRSRLAGCAGPPVQQPWWDLIRLVRKETVLAESASIATSYAPVVCAAVTAVVACLVPSFALGMTFASFADVLVIFGLLMAARCSVALAAMDAGTAMGGVASSRSMLLLVPAGPVLLLVILVLALLAGSLNLDLIAATQMESGAIAHAEIALAFAALLLVALIETGGREALAEDLSGIDLALIEASNALRLLVWFNLIGVLFLPFGMAPAGAGALAWLLGLVAWFVRTIALTAILALLRALLGRLRFVQVAQVLGVAVLAGLLAAIVLFAGMRTA